MNRITTALEAIDLEHRRDELRRHRNKLSRYEPPAVPDLAFPQTRAIEQATREQMPRLAPLEVRSGYSGGVNVDALVGLVCLVGSWGVVITLGWLIKSWAE